MKYKQTISNNTGVKKNEFLPGYSYEDGIRFDVEDPVNEMMEIMARFLIEYLSDGAKVLDIGAGSGALKHYMAQLNPSIDIITLDGNPDTKLSPFIDKDKHFIVRTDKEYKIVDETGNCVKFDLIVSFEHLEHIQEENFEQFLNNILNHSCEKTVFFATAAKWEHEGENEKHVHCNVKTSDEWASYFKDFLNKNSRAPIGYVCDLKKYADVVRENLLQTLPHARPIGGSERPWRHSGMPSAEMRPAPAPAILHEMYDYFFCSPFALLDEEGWAWGGPDQSGYGGWGHRLFESTIIFLSGYKI